MPDRNPKQIKLQCDYCGGHFQAANPAYVHKPRIQRLIANTAGLLHNLKQKISSMTNWQLVVGRLAGYIFSGVLLPVVIIMWMVSIGDTRDLPFTYSVLCTAGLMLLFVLARSCAKEMHRRGNIW
jgi:hypothetical protein